MHTFWTQPLPFKGMVEGSQRKFVEQANPALHGMSLHPCPYGSENIPDAHVLPLGQTYPSPAQRAGEHPCASAVARTGAQIEPAPHANPAVHGVGSHLPLAAHRSPDAQESIVHSGLHCKTDGHPPKLGTDTQSDPFAQSLSRRHGGLGGGKHPPGPETGSWAQEKSGGQSFCERQVA